LKPTASPQPPPLAATLALRPLARAAKNVTQMLHAPLPRLRCEFVGSHPLFAPPLLIPSHPAKISVAPYSIFDTTQVWMVATTLCRQNKRVSKHHVNSTHKMSQNKRTMILPTRENPTWASATTSYPILCEDSHPPFAPVEAVSATKQTDALAGSIKRGGKGGVYERHGAAANRKIMRVRVVDCSQPQLSFTPVAQTSCNNGNDNILKAGAALTEPRWSRIARGVRSQLSFLLPF